MAADMRPYLITARLNGERWLPLVGWGESLIDACNDARQMVAQDDAEEWEVVIESAYPVPRPAWDAMVAAAERAGETGEVYRSGPRRRPGKAAARRPGPKEA